MTISLGMPPAGDMKRKLKDVMLRGITVDKKKYLKLLELRKKVSKESCDKQKEYTEELIKVNDKVREEVIRLIIKNNYFKKLNWTISYSGGRFYLKASIDAIRPTELNSLLSQGFEIISPLKIEEWIVVFIKESELMLEFWNLSHLSQFLSMFSIKKVKNLQVIANFLEVQVEALREIKKELTKSD